MKFRFFKRFNKNLNFVFLYKYDLIKNNNLQKNRNIFILRDLIINFYKLKWMELIKF